MTNRPLLFVFLCLLVMGLIHATGDQSVISIIGMVTAGFGFIVGGVIWIIEGDLCQYDDEDDVPAA